MQEASGLNFVFTTRLPFLTAAFDFYSQINQFAMSYVNSFWRVTGQITGHRREYDVLVS
jgi:hypothetical protein